MAKSAEEKAAEKAAKEQAKADEKAAKDAAKAAEKAAKNSDAVTVRYRDHRGEVTERTFSKEVHGDDFAERAEEFKATNAKACEGLN